MSDVKTMVQRLAGSTGFDSTLERAVVVSVDKNDLTCEVKLVDDDSLLPGVKLKPVESEGNGDEMGLILYPAIGSFVIIGQINKDNTDLYVLSATKLESIGMDAGTAFKLLLNVSSGSIGISAAGLIFNGGKNGGLPFSQPLQKSISALQKQVNDLIDRFNSHTHPGVSSGSSSTGKTITTGPAKTSEYMTLADIENKAIQQ